MFTPLPLRRLPTLTVPYRALQRCYLRRLSTTPSPPKRALRMAVIGSGPAGFYTSYRVLSKIPDATVDMYEALPTPYGLVRFGVAPDHPEVKNCQDKFDSVASEPRFRFLGNIPIGTLPGQLPLSTLVPHYDALLLSYGSSKDRELNIPGEHTLKGIYSARSFVGWYNGHPEQVDLSPDLCAGEEAIVLGQGNVALDVARILLTDIDVLRKTDITSYALEALSKSRIKRVRVVGRRGPAQVSFTIKEVRELFAIKDVSFTPIPRRLFPPDISTFPRAQRRLLEILQKGGTSTAPITSYKTWELDFLLSPVSFLPSPTNPSHLSHIKFQYTQLPQSDLFSPTAKATYLPQSTTLPCSLAFKSIGYLSTPLPEAEHLGIPFNPNKGLIPNESGRVVIPQLQHHHHQEGETETNLLPTTETGVITCPGVYTSGWVKRGPTGVIASTMYDAFETGDAIVEDWVGGKEFMRYGSRIDVKKGDEDPRGWEALEGVGVVRERGLRPVSWEEWKVIERVEMERGRGVGKEREKFARVEEMLGVIG